MSKEIKDVWGFIDSILKTFDPGWVSFDCSDRDNSIWYEMKSTEFYYFIDLDPKSLNIPKNFGEDFQWVKNLDFDHESNGRTAVFRFNGLFYKLIILDNSMGYEL